MTPRALRGGAFVTPGGRGAPRDETCAALLRLLRLHLARLALAELVSRRPPVICSYLPCGAAAVPGRAPHLCPAHVELVICPACEWWRWGDRAGCVVCRGHTYVSEAGAREAIRVWLGRRWEAKERPDVPQADRDRRWRDSPVWYVYGDPDAGLNAPQEAILHAEGRGGCYPIDQGPIAVPEPHSAAKHSCSRDEDRGGP